MNGAGYYLFLYLLYKLFGQLQSLALRCVAQLCNIIADINNSAANFNIERFIVFGILINN